MNLASRLKQARKSRGYTQNALAVAIGASRGVISNIEYEKVEPQVLVVHAICEVLRIDENWLTSGEGSMENTPSASGSARLLSDIYNASKELSEQEQGYILDMIKMYRKHHNSSATGKDE